MIIILIFLVKNRLGEFKNMKRKLVVILFLMFSFISIANAECDYKTKLEVNTAASNVAADIEMKTVVLDLDENEHPEIENIEETEDPTKYVYADYFYLNITNINDKINLEISNEDDNFYQTLKYQDTDNGKYQFKVPDVSIIRTYTIKIYSNVSECGNEEIRTLEVKAPMFNDLYGTRLCEDNDALYCSKYITNPVNIDSEEMLEKKDANSKEDETAAEDNNGNNKIFILLSMGIIIVLIIAIIFTIFMQKKKSKIISLE